MLDNLSYVLIIYWYIIYYGHTPLTMDVISRSGCRIMLSMLLFYYTRPSVRDLDQPVQMVTHASDWGNSLNQHSSRGGKQLTMVVAFVGCLCWVMSPLLYHAYHRKPTEWVFFCSHLNPYKCKDVKSLTAKSILAGTKDSHSEGFFLAKHTAHKHPHHDELFSPPAACFLWNNVPHPREPLQKGLGKDVFEGFNI